MSFLIGNPIKLKGGVNYKAHVSGKEAVWPSDAKINLVSDTGAVLATFEGHGHNVKRIKVADNTTAQFQSDIETKNVTGTVEVAPVGSYVP